MADIERAVSRFKSLNMSIYEIKNRIDELTDHIRALSIDLDALYVLRTELSADDEDLIYEVEHLLRCQKYVEAIKVYRSATKAGLYEAKRAVDSIRDRILPTIPPSTQ